MLHNVRGRSRGTKDNQHRHLVCRWSVPDRTSFEAWGPSSSVWQIFSRDLSQGPKRKILSTVGSLFEPLGFPVHFFFPSKLFFSSYGELMLHGKIRYKTLSPCLMLPIWMELHKLNLKCHWWCRPAFRLCPEEERPSLSISLVSEHYSDVQLKKSVMSITQRSSIKQLLKHFSSWPGLLTIVMAIWSDDGTNFTSADREIPLAIRQWKR